MKRLLHLILIASMALAPITGGFAFVSIDSDMHAGTPCPNCDHEQAHSTADKPCEGMHCDLDGCSASISLTFIEQPAVAYHFTRPKPVFPRGASDRLGKQTTPPLFRPPIS